MLCANLIYNRGQCKSALDGDTSALELPLLLVQGLTPCTESHSPSHPTSLREKDQSCHVKSLGKATELLQTASVPAASPGWVSRAKSPCQRFARPYQSWLSIHGARNCRSSMGKLSL